VYLTENFISSASRRFMKAAYLCKTSSLEASTLSHLCWQFRTSRPTV